MISLRPLTLSTSCALPQLRLDRAWRLFVEANLPGIFGCQDEGRLITIDISEHTAMIHGLAIDYLVASGLNLNQLTQSGRCWAIPTPR